MICDEAKIFATRLNDTGFGLELFPGLVQIELLIAETQSVPGRSRSACWWGVPTKDREDAPLYSSRSEDFMLHPELIRVEVHRSGDVAAREDDMINGFYCEVC